MKLFGLILAILALATVPVLAQAPVLQVGGLLVVSQDDLFTRSAAGKRIVSDVEAATQALVQQNRGIETELIVEEKELTERRAQLSAEEFRALADEFDERVQQIRSEQDAKSDAIRAQLESARRQYFQTIIPILAEILREERAVAILEKRTVLLSINLIDITDRAIARIDAQLGEGTGLIVDQ